MYQRVREYIRRYHMLDKGDRIITGVSGGADSVCLLFMLRELREELGLSVLAVHVHHGLRGEDADADAEYVRRICDEWGVGLRTFREDVRKLAGQSGLSLEEAGRDIRREIFLKVRGELGSGKIALAHHQNDNAETLIWNLCRGCGIRGLGGIAPVTGAVTGGLLGFLLFNVYPASVFMGDTGSLALGGFVAATAYVLQMPIFILIVAMIYWVELLSVMIQVTYFKKTGGKRIFRMAPIHHHFELGGWSETRVVAVFSIVTAILCLIGVLAL